MTTEKQIAANRLNALMAGVRTDEGKAAVRLNALSHGFFSKDLLLPGEDGGLLADLRRRYLDELQPAGELETLLVERIISSAWRLKRMVVSEKAQFRVRNFRPSNWEDASPGTSSPDAARPFTRMVDYTCSELQNVLRYETTLERQIFKAMHELERLQKMRLGESVTAPLAMDVDVNIDTEN
jgi:hypothetical protein